MARGAKQTKKDFRLLCPSRHFCHQCLRSGYGAAASENTIQQYFRPGESREFASARIMFACVPTFKKTADYDTETDSNFHIKMG